MDTGQAVSLFENNWFLRREEKLELTVVEQQFIEASMGPAPKRWEGKPEIERMSEIRAGEPRVLERIGGRLLQVLIGMRGCGPAVTFLLERNVPLEIDVSSYNVLHEAAWGGMVDTLRAVFESGAADATCVSIKKPHVGWPDNLSLMYWAAAGWYPDCARLFIQYGAGVHHELPIKGNGERGTTSLQEAAASSPGGKDGSWQERGLAVARILIEDGAYYDVYSACALDDTSRLNELIERDPDVANAADDYGMTPLHWAVRAGSKACTEILLACGVQVDAFNKARRTPLQLAAEGNRVETIRLLAERGADLNTQDRKGRTPLHRAMYEGRVAAAEALLEAGADPTVLNKRGKNAFEVARKEAKRYKKRA
ncbi:MAG: ankyrin repeat domain-containing protein [Gemmatimonadota bacterium]|nr:ankyrin repeat domain-containing protein [Gemmatimonadota bacterium]